MVHGIDRTNFTMRVMERSIAFYRNIIGMRIAWESKEAGVQFKGQEIDKATGCLWEGDYK